MISNHLVPNVQTLADLKAAVDTMISVARVTKTPLDTIYLGGGATYDLAMGDERLMDGSLVTNVRLTERDA